MASKSRSCSRRSPHHEAGCGRDLHRGRVPGSGDHRRGAVAAGRIGGYLHAGRADRVARPSGRADLFCLSGVGRICFKGEKPQVLNPGDTVNIPPDTLHWHGAAPDRLFSHLALSEAGEQGQGTAWGQHVNDTEYNEAPSA